MSAFEGHTDIGARPGHLQRPPRATKPRRRGGGGAAKGAVGVSRGRVAAALALLALAICAAAVLLNLGTHPARSVHRDAPLTSHGLLSLPSALRGPASQTLGSEDPAYRAAATPGGLRVNNSAQRLSAAFAASGVTVHSGKLALGLRLTAAGYGARPGTVAAATPTGVSNRVTYNRGWIQEWYANGPAGLEQGFTIPRAPRTAARNQLQLSALDLRRRPREPPRRRQGHPLQRRARVAHLRRPERERRGRASPAAAGCSCRAGSWFCTSTPATRPIPCGSTPSSSRDRR